MRFIPYSNSVHKFNSKKKRDHWRLGNIILIVLILLIVSGVLGQVIITKFNAENSKSRNKYVRVNNNKYYFKDRGQGDYTVVYDGALGSGMEQWSESIKKLGVDFDGNIFSYDRSGYGFNDFEKQSIESQARTLRMLLKKSGKPSPYLLVGEEYGCLVLSAFSSLYPDEVQGVIFINPLNEKYLGDSNYIRQYKSQKIRKVIEKNGSYFSLTAILNSLNLTKNPTGLMDALSDEDLKDFNRNRIQNSYNSAYYTELNNIINYKNEENGNVLQKDNLLKGKPFSIIVNDSRFKNQQVDLQRLGDKDNTNIIEVSSEKDIIATEKADIIASNVSNIAKKLKVIIKLQQDKIKNSQ
ncbi:alpha/beta fold hydrolase [Inconstantimicrobium mannanitabidum]|uniref:Uncharacterized protein n=1 Tax=Inconstantimicrobium mannanitabidum TaxID=1604901 RepID=A0ACB5R716_9CLOT|nr:alpha/beta hydrolase [Clostridium sp. TW13]GKX64900.1 hypothetical protein rsdtw13_01580 [Clostridium sp. TW13]